jgi:hypothetical protein
VKQKKGKRRRWKAGREDEGEEREEFFFLYVIQKTKKIKNGEDDIFCIIPFISVYLH